MKKTVIATLLAASAVALLLFVFLSTPTKIVSQPEPVVETAEVVMQAQQASDQSIADMSLPMPLGLAGDPVKGSDFFMENCVPCHGQKGDGDGPRAYFITPPPRNFLLETSRQKLNRPALFEAIMNGRLGTNMPAWGKVLNDQEIANVAEFVFQHFIISPQGNNGKQD